MKLYGKLREFVERKDWTLKIRLLGYPCIYGEHRGYQFKFHFGAHKGFFLTHRLCNVLTMPVQNPMYVDLKLQGGALASLASLARSPGLQTGDKIFDQQFILNGKPKEYIIKLFENDDIRRGFKKAQLRLGKFSIKVKQQNMICETTSLAGYSEKSIMEILDVVSDLADAIKKL